MKSRGFVTAILLLSSASVAEGAPPDLNAQVLSTVDWLVEHKSGLGYDLRSRFTDDLHYGDRTIASRRGPKTMCVAAVYEVLVRTLADVKDSNGQPAYSLLDPKQVAGNTPLALEPYIFQYRSKSNFDEYKRPFSAGAGDAFVLFGIGRFVKFDEAKPGDFLYFHRSGGTGHAVIFKGFLDSEGKLTESSASASGFRYFSAQHGGTNGMGLRDAFFGQCPKIKTENVKDCGVVRSDDRAILAVSRLHAPDAWFARYSPVRIKEFLIDGKSIDDIYADEARFRAETVARLEAAAKTARIELKPGFFPMDASKADSVLSAAEIATKAVKFNDSQFGPDFSEPPVPEEPDSHQAGSQ